MKGSGINPSCNQGDEDGIKKEGEGSRNGTPPLTLPIGHQWKAISCTRSQYIKEIHVPFITVDTSKEIR